MFWAFSCSVSLLARVVLPTAGVPVIRMMRLFTVGYTVLGNSYCLRLRFSVWAGELVCGFRALNLMGLRKLRPRVELHLL